MLLLAIPHETLLTLSKGVFGADLVCNSESLIGVHSLTIQLTIPSALIKNELTRSLKKFYQSA